MRGTCLAVRARSACARLIQGDFHGVEYPALAHLGDGAHEQRVDGRAAACLPVSCCRRHLLPHCHRCACAARVLPAQPRLPLSSPLTAPVFRLPAQTSRPDSGIGCLTLAAWCWGACLFFWGVGRVNYGFLFEFDERSRHRSHSEACARACLRLCSELALAPPVAVQCCVQLRRSCAEQPTP